MGETITIPMSDYKRLLLAAEADDTVVWCAECGAWLDHERASVGDFTGCWWAATRRDEYLSECVRYRSLSAHQ